MMLFETSVTRRFIGRLERGESIVSALIELANSRSITTAWLSGLGAFEQVELVEYDQALKVYKPSQFFDTPCEILSLVGNLSTKDGAPFAHVHTTVSRETDNGIQVLGGHLISGRVFACELSIECFDGLSVERERDLTTGLHLWTRESGERGGTTRSQPGHEPSRNASTSSRAPVSWADVAEATRTESRPPPARVRPLTDSREPAFVPPPIPERTKAVSDVGLDEPTPEKGSFIEHKQFGLCRVDGEDLEGGLLIRLPSGARKVIRLEYLKVLPPRIDGDRTIYPLIPRRRS